MDDVSKGPNKWNSEEGNAEKNDVQDNSQKQIGEPYSSAVHHPRVGVHLAVSHAHIHAEQRETMLTRTKINVLFREKPIMSHQWPL